MTTAGSTGGGVYFTIPKDSIGDKILSMESKLRGLQREIDSPENRTTAFPTVLVELQGLLEKELADLKAQVASRLLRPPLCHCMLASPALAPKLPAWLPRLPSHSRSSPSPAVQNVDKSKKQQIVKPSMQIFVRVLDSHKSLSFDISTDAMVGELQSLIADQTGTSIRIQRPHGPSLDPTSRLSELGIVTGDTLSAVGSLRGGLVRSFRASEVPSLRSFRLRPRLQILPAPNCSQLSVVCRVGSPSTGASSARTSMPTMISRASSGTTRRSGRRATRT